MSERSERIIRQVVPERSDGLRSERIIRQVVPERSDGLLMRTPPQAVGT
jgi:hypothetical protein